MHDSQADISKAKALLGYAPTIGLEEGLRRTSNGAVVNALPRRPLIPATPA